MYIGSKEFKIPQRASRGLIAAIVLAVIASSAAGYFAIKAAGAESARAASSAKLSQVTTELENKNKALAALEKSSKEHFDKVKEDSAHEIASLREQLAAFAKQAAACEVLRKKIGR